MAAARLPGALQAGVMRAAGQFAPVAHGALPWIAAFPAWPAALFKMVVRAALLEAALADEQDESALSRADQAPTASPPAATGELVEGPHGGATLPDGNQEQHNLRWCAMPQIQSWQVVLRYFF
jgi:hypothetical protein